MATTELADLIDARVLTCILCEAGRRTHTCAEHPKVLFSLLTFVSAVVSSKSLTSLSSTSNAATDGAAPSAVALAGEIVWISET